MILFAISAMVWYLLIFTDQGRSILYLIPVLRFQPRVMPYLIVVGASALMEHFLTTKRRRRRDFLFSTPSFLSVVWNWVSWNYKVLSSILVHIFRLDGSWFLFKLKLISVEKRIEILRVRSLPIPPTSKLREIEDRVLKSKAWRRVEALLAEAEAREGELRKEIGKIEDARLRPINRGDVVEVDMGSTGKLLSTTLSPKFLKQLESEVPRSEWREYWLKRVGEKAVQQVLSDLKKDPEYRLLKKQHSRSQNDQSELRKQQRRLRWNNDPEWKRISKARLTVMGELHDLERVVEDEIRSRTWKSEETMRDKAIRNVDVVLARTLGKEPPKKKHWWSGRDSWWWLWRIYLTVFGGATLWAVITGLLPLFGWA